MPALIIPSRKDIFLSQTTVIQKPLLYNSVIKQRVSAMLSRVNDVEHLHFIFF